MAEQLIAHKPKYSHISVAHTLAATKLSQIFMRGQDYSKSAYSFMEYVWVHTVFAIKIYSKKPLK